MGGVGEASKPNLFLIGVLRSATTAMNRYLGAHPEVFMATKELHYFGADLADCPDGPEHGSRLGLEAYLAHFADSGAARYRGDASVGYVYSTTAAREIHDFCPEARIVVSFRNPVDVTYSLYSLLRFQGLEPSDDFLGAVLDETHGRRALTATEFRWCYTYRSLCHYAEQLERYLEVFGRERVHVVVYEDLARDSTAEYRRLLGFLGIDADVDTELPVFFSNRRLRSRRLQELLFHPPAPVRGAVRTLVRRQGTRRRLAARLAERNVEVAPRAPLAPDVRRQLDEVFRDDVERLGHLLDRDLCRLWQPSSN